MFLEGPHSLEVTAISCALLSLTLYTATGLLTPCTISFTYFALSIVSCVL